VSPASGENIKCYLTIDMVVILLNILKEQSHQYLASLLKAKRHIVIYVWSSSIKMGIPVHGNYNKYVWIAMARMEMASDLKTSGRIFQVSPLVSHMKSRKINFGLFLF